MILDESNVRSIARSGRDQFRISADGIAPLTGTSCNNRTRNGAAARDRRAAARSKESPAAYCQTVTISPDTTYVISHDETSM